MPAWGRALGLNLSEPSVQPQPLEDNEIVAVEAGFSLRVLHTPGHSPGQVAYYVEALQLLVVGDTLFFGSVGRSDLPGGNSKQLIESIRSRLYTLPDDTKVVPGHGPHTTIGREKRENPFVRAD
jgi:glyoxylase-like metal-dependent hydrolase (beta-lactamase superfamily II)